MSKIHFKYIMCGISFLAGVGCMVLFYFYYSTNEELVTSKLGEHQLKFRISSLTLELDLEKRLTSALRNETKAIKQSLIEKSVAYDVLLKEILIHEANKMRLEEKIKDNVEKLQRKHDELVAIQRKHDELVAIQRKHDELVAFQRKHDELVAFQKKYNELVAFQRKHDELVAIQRKHDELVAFQRKHGELAAFQRKPRDSSSFVMSSIVLNFILYWVIQLCNYWT